MVSGLKEKWAEGKKENRIFFNVLNKRTLTNFSDQERTRNQPIRLPGLKPGGCSGLILSGAFNPGLKIGVCRRRTYQEGGQGKRIEVMRDGDFSRKQAADTKGVTLLENAGRASESHLNPLRGGTECVV